MVILDTSIIIDHLRSNKINKTSTLLSFVASNPSESLALSVISVQELYEGKSTTFPKRETELLSIIAPMKILPYDYQTAKLAGQIARDIPSPLELADCAIAASAILNNCGLLTLNTKDFSKIKLVKLIELLSFIKR